MGKSTLRHVVKRRVHLERAQPAHRKKLGVLEKHSDYVKRAKLHHKREDQIRIMAEKARTRNKDEFNYKMIRAAKQTENGTIILKSDKNLDSEAELIQETLDINLIAAKRQAEKKQLERLQSTLPASALGVKPKRSIFVDDSELQDIKRRKKNSLPIPDKYANKNDFTDPFYSEDIANSHIKQLEDFEAKHERVITLNRVMAKLQSRKESKSKEEKKKVKVTKDGVEIFKFANKRSK